MAVQQDARADATAARLGGLLELRGDEEALDVGTGAGAFALALAPRVRRVVGLDLVPELLAEARKRAPANVELLEADATALPFGDGVFDLVTSARTLHHVARPGRVLAEIARVLRPGGTALVVDQLAPADCAAALNAFERARDPSTSTVLTDAEIRALFEAAGLAVRHAEHEREPRDLERYLDLAACTGEARARAVALAPRPLVAELGWYVLTLE